MATADENKSDIRLDLDALAPKAVQIRFKDEILEVFPPSLEDYVIVSDLKTKVSAMGGDPDIKEAVDIFKDANNIIGKVVPKLAEVKLNYVQILALFGLILELGAPTDDVAVAELKKRGITLTTPDNPNPKDSAS